MIPESHNRQEERIEYSERHGVKALQKALASLFEKLGDPVEKIMNSQNGHDFFMTTKEVHLKITTAGDEGSRLIKGEMDVMKVLDPNEEKKKFCRRNRTFAKKHRNDQKTHGIEASKGTPNPGSHAKRYF